MTDIDASSKLSREEYEQLIDKSLNRIPGPLQRALEDSGLSLDQIDAIELVGGSTRIPAVRARIQSVFPGKVLSTTLNQDEACARGATFACATLSPVFRVRDFALHDIAPYPIKIRWEKSPEDPDDDTELTVFPRGNSLPSTKVLTFYRKDTFDLEAVYGEPEKLPGSINPWLAKLTAKNIPSPSSGDLAVVKVKTRLNLHGVISFEQVYTEEIEEKEEPMAVDGEPSTEPPKKKKVKKDVAFVAAYGKLDSSVVEKFKEREAQMQAADKLVQDTEVSTYWPKLNVDDLRLTAEFRTAKTLSRSTSTICVPSLTNVMSLSSSLRRRRSSLSNSRRTKTGFTPRRAKRLLNPHTLTALPPFTPSAT